MYQISWRNVEIVKKVIGRTEERIEIWNDQCFAPWLNVKNTQPDGQLIHAMLLHQAPDIMQEELKRCTQESGDSGSVNQIECMERALGQRRGHIRGVSRVVRHPTPDVSSTYPPQQGEWQNQMDERVEQLQQQLQQQERDRERSCHGGDEPSNGRNASPLGATTSS
ncbi:hypothetical protein E3N88_04538 [Mikania micrantha]|uniref:Uncharacterized protein n=1 Tax=Mikania micrantha TaxID=192012 RepID=A0A5N6PXI4_9ASTR|nr:hypothetical protein E3N88_04538 [Mikania micrantha]